MPQSYPNLCYEEYASMVMSLDPEVPGYSQRPIKNERRISLANQKRQTRKLNWGQFIEISVVKFLLSENIVRIGPNLEDLLVKR